MEIITNILDIRARIIINKTGLNGAHQFPTYVGYLGI